MAITQFSLKVMEISIKFSQNKVFLKCIAKSIRLLLNFFIKEKDIFIHKKPIPPISQIVQSYFSSLYLLKLNVIHFQKSVLCIFNLLSFIWWASKGLYIYLFCFHSLRLLGLIHFLIFSVSHSTINTGSYNFPNITYLDCGPAIKTWPWTLFPSCMSH